MNSGVLGTRRRVGPGGVPGSPPRQAELAPVAAWEPGASRRCSSQVLLWEFLAAACAPCKIPGGIFAAGRRDAYRSGKRGLLQPRLCVCAWREGGAPLMPLGRARMVLGAQGAAARWPWLQGVAAQGNRAGLLASSVPPASLLGWVGSGAISGQRVHLWRAQLQAFCTQELPGVRAVVSPNLAGDGFWSSSSEFLICAGVGWRGPNTGDSLGAQQRAGEQQLSRKSCSARKSCSEIPVGH